MSERFILWHRWLPPRQEDAGAYGEVACWQRSVATRFSVAGGTLLGAVGGTVVASFDPSDLLDTVEMALDLLEEADGGALEVAIGAAIGPLEDIEGASVGAAIERAQLFANRARPGELVLDAGSRALAASELLFGRHVAASAGWGRGAVVDRSHPRRSEHAGGIAALGSTPLPPIIDSVRRQIDEALSTDAARTFVLRGPVGAGATELLSALERSRSPSHVLRIGASPGGVVPLASLRLALGRRLGAPSKIEKTYPGMAGAVLAHLSTGALVAQHALADALVELVRGAEGERAWVVLSPMSLVDGATLGALLEARARGADFVLFGRFPVEHPLPRPLIELDEEVLELTLPPLKTADARVVAEAILGSSTPDEVARRVAVLGGDTVLGVVEAARTLIATGELVRQGEAFMWRVAPRHGASSIGTEELLAERLELLDPGTRRVLEAACVVPDGWPAALLGEVAALDDIGEGAFADSLETLSREALLTGRDHPRPASSILRWHLLAHIPPARFTELHRFVADVLRAHAPSSAPMRAELGYYLLEGGLDTEARPHLVYAAEMLVESGYERAARQLSAWLAQRDEERAREAAGAPPAPATADAFEESPPSSEYFLDELLEEASEEQARQLGFPKPAKPLPPPKPLPVPPKALPPPPPARLLPKAPPLPSRALVAPASLSKGAADPPRGIDAHASALDSVDEELVVTRERPLEPLSDTLEATSSEQAIETRREVDAGARPGEALFAMEDEPHAMLHVAPPAPLDAELDALLESTPPAAGFDAELDALLADAPDAPDEDDEGMASERTSISPAPLRPFVQDAVRALRERDFAALEQAISRAIADGSDLGAVGRVRAVAELARGDLDAARRRLRESGSSERNDQHARHHLAMALLELHDGDPMMGIRATLAALAVSRRIEDARGEAAALHVLAACYRALGREEQARRLDARPI